MSDNIFGLDVLLKQEETGLVRYSSRMYEKDWDRLINLRRHKVVELGDRSYNNTSAIEEAVEILQSKYDIPRGETPTKLVSGRRGREVKHKSKDTSIMLSKETVDYIKDFLAYKAYVQGDIGYTRMKFFEEEFISSVLFKIVLPHIALSSGFAFMELIVAKFFGFCKCKKSGDFRRCSSFAALHCRVCKNSKLHLRSL